MFACVYFEEDNTISVIRKGHRDLKCEKFSPNERCVMKWGNAEFEGIIIEVSDKEPKLKKLASSLVKDVLHKAAGDPVPLLQEFVQREGQKETTPKKRKVEKETVAPKKKAEAPKKSVTYADIDMGLGDTSLTETWKLINQQADDMSTPHMVAPQSHSSNSVEVSDNMITILKQLATDTFQNECRKLVKALESQQSSLESRTLINMDASPANSEITMPFASCLPDFPDDTSTSVCLPQPSTSVCLPQPSSVCLPQPSTSVCLPQPSSVCLPQPDFTYDRTGKLFELLPVHPEPKITMQLPVQVEQTSLATSFSQTPYVSPVQQQEIPSAVMAQRTSTPNGQLSLDTSISSQTPVQLVKSPKVKSRTPPKTSSRTELFSTRSSFAVRSSPRNLSKTPPRPLPNSTKRCLDVSQETDKSQSNSEMVRLVENSDVMVKRNDLRKACSQSLKHPKQAYTLLSKLLPCIFTTTELAMSRGQGLTKPKKGDLRPVLDEKKMRALKDYVTMWVRKHGFSQPEENELNSAVTQQIHYARQKQQGKGQK